MNTRAADKLYLIGHDESHIEGSKLPSNLQVLRLLLYKVRKEKYGVQASCHIIVKQLEVFWSKARIPIRDFYRCTSKLESLYAEYRNLMKSCKKRTSFQEKRKRILWKNSMIYLILHMVTHWN